MQKEWRSLFEVLVKKHNFLFVHCNLHHNKLCWRTTTLWSCIVPQFLCQISPSLTQYLVVSENLYVRVLRWVMKWAASIFNLQSVTWTILQMPDLSVFYIVPTKYNDVFFWSAWQAVVVFWFLKCSYEFFMLIWSCLYFLLEPLKKQHACYGKLTLKWYAGFGVAELSISQQDKFLFFAKLCKVLVEPYIVKTPC